MFREYWRNPEENAARFRGDWYLTGDVAKRDADGYYWFVGRADDVIKSAGYRIGPFEVESALIEHPAVVEAAVVGKPDATRGQIVKAFVVLRKGHSPCDALATRASGTLQTCHRALQVSARDRVRGRIAEDDQRQDSPGGIASARLSFVEPGQACRTLLELRKPGLRPKSEANSIRPGNHHKG